MQWRLSSSRVKKRNADTPFTSAPSLHMVFGKSFNGAFSFLRTSNGSTKLSIGQRVLVLAEYINSYKCQCFFLMYKRKLNREVGPYAYTISSCMCLFVMLQTKVIFYGKYFMACFLLCVKQIERYGNWCMVKIKERCWPYLIIHHIASSVSGCPVVTHIW